MRNFFVLICFLITYGSLYPFHISYGIPSFSDILPLLHFNPFEATLGDAISNIVLFLPFGYLLASSWQFPNKRSQLLWCIVIAFSFGYVVQVLQLWAIGRVPWGGDASLNTIGAVLGCIIASNSKSWHFLSNNRDDSLLKVTVFLGVGLLVIKLGPFAPSMDIGVLKSNLKGLLHNPSLDFYWLFEHTVTWSVAFFFLAFSNSSLTRGLNLVFVAIGILFLKFFIISNDIDISQMVAAVLALIVFYTFEGKINKSLLGISLLLTIILNGFYPFELRSEIGQFEWVPFTGALNGNVLINILATAKKLLLYSSAIVILQMSGMRMRIVASIVFVVVASSEFGQVFVTNSVPESTDVFLVLIATYLLNFFGLRKVVMDESTNSPDVFENLVSNQKRKLKEQSRTTKPSIEYISGLDGLRAFAAFSVFIVHFQQFTNADFSFGILDITRWMINGNTGVALFFTLSGFLLAIPYWKGLYTDDFPNISRYLKRRAVRIIPLYYLCFIGLLALKGFSGPDATFNNVISHLLFLHNLKDGQVMSLNPPFWTLAVEFQFYLVLPIIFLLLKNLTYRVAQLALFTFIIFWFFTLNATLEWMTTSISWPIEFPLIWPFGVYASSATSPAITYSLASHLPHFLLGTLLASQHIKHNLKKKYLLYDFTVLVISLIIFLILSTPLDDHLQVGFGRYNFPYIPVLLAILVFCVPLSRYVSQMLDVKPVRALGVISYGIYIFHYPIQKAFKILFESFSFSVSQNWLLYGFLTFGVTIALSSLSYRFFERPVMNYFNGGGRNSNAHMRQGRGRFLDESVDKPSANSLVAWKTINRKNVVFCSLFFLLVAVFVGIKFKDSETDISQPYWAGSQNEVIFDHHAHTKYSDGSLSLNDLTELAYFNGCDAMSITDHSGYGEGVSTNKLREISRLREKYDGMLIFSGIEIGLPSYQGREHLNIIVAPKYENGLLPKLTHTLKKSRGIEGTGDQSFIKVINEYFKDGLEGEDYITVYNHPSRKDKSLGENVKDFEALKEHGLSINAFAGAPGHQKNSEIGSYESLIKTENRWDPFVAIVGGGWDTLLAKGEKVWGAVASSDFHNDSLDYAPCGFSRIHLRVPEKTYSGVLKAFEKGTFWADHNGLLYDYEFYLEAGPNNSVAYPGGTVTLANKNSVMLVNAKVSRAEKFKNSFLKVDIISNCMGDNVTSVEKLLAPEDSVTQLLLSKTNSAEQCFVRSRVILDNASGDDIAAYSNPIFIR